MKKVLKTIATSMLGAVILTVSLGLFAPTKAEAFDRNFVVTEY
ncbi:MAG: hypothetical protein AAF693_00640 [Bacteroidota bacterium]